MLLLQNKLIKFVKMKYFHYMKKGVRIFLCNKNISYQEMKQSK